MNPTFLASVWNHTSSESRSDHVSQRNRQTVEQLEARLEKALLTMEAIWALARDRLGLTDQELVDEIVEIDLGDGVVDGKVRRPAMVCTSCDRRIPRRHARCLYCGTEVPPAPFG